jgi:hypothetical protein
MQFRPSTIITGGTLLALLASPSCRRSTPVAPSAQRAASGFRAYSLREAKRRWGVAVAERELTQLNGITAIAGMVYDVKTDDRIIVGRANPGQPPITLDDFVVAARAVLIKAEFPLVSIDRTAATRKTHKQAVVFRGDIANSSYGKDLLEADVTLKKLALELLPPPFEGWQSYFSATRERVLHGKADDVVASRFWFYIQNERSFASVDDVFAIRQMRIGTKTETLYAVQKGKSIDDPSKVEDPSAAEFAAQLSAHYFDVAKSHQAVARVKTLFDLVALAVGIQTLPRSTELLDWLRAYAVPHVDTPSEYELLTNGAKLPGTDLQLELNGGIEVRARVLRLKGGDTSAMKEAVLLSRPRADSLGWSVPLEGWEIPDALPVQGDLSAASGKVDEAASPAPDSPACTIEVKVHGKAKPAREYDGPIRAPEEKLPTFAIQPRLLPKEGLGGVLIAPPLNTEHRDLQHTRRSVLEARPSDDAVIWHPGSAPAPIQPKGEVRK